MLEAGSLLLIAGAAAALGWLIVPLFPPLPPLQPLEHWMVRLGAGVIIIGLLALALAQTGRFSIGALAMLLLLIGTGAFWVKSRRREPARTPPPAEAQALWLWSENPPPGAEILKPKFVGHADAEHRARPHSDDSARHTLHAAGRREVALLGLWLAVAGWLFLRPHEFIVGGADAGVYVNLAASIHTNGSILIQDEVLAALDPALYPVLLRSLPSTEASPYYLLPGFYVMGEPRGQVTPQFYPLHPVWQAVAYGLGGVRAALLLPGLWALLGSLAIYLFARRLMGWPAAMLALAGLSLNALQVWFARYPTAETLTQFLLWLGLWALGVWLMNEQAPAPFLGLLAGLALGQVMLVRIDTYFLLGIPLAVGVWLLWHGRLRREHGWFFVPMGLTAVYSLVHALWQSAPYFTNTFGYVLLMVRLYWPAVAATAVAGLALLLLALRYRQQLNELGRYRAWILATAMAVIVLLAAYAWFIRPFTANVIPDWQDWYGGRPVANYDHENLRRLGWYLAPFGVWLGVAGMALLTWRFNRYTAVLLGVGLFFSLLYLWRIQANPHQIYTMRRYVPVVMPFFILSAAAFCAWLGWQRSRWLQGTAVLLATLWLGGLGWSARGFISQVDYHGLIAQMEQLNAQLAPRAILIFNDQTPVSDGDIWGTPLHLMYGHNVFSLRRLEGEDDARLATAVAQWQAAGRTVYWVGDTGWLDAQHLPYTSQVYTITTQVLESAYERKPTQRIPIQREFLFSQLQPN